jgi:1,4-alpha-glucan branching enzyme
MPTGYFALVLHAHLPFVRHPEDPTVMEEQWLYEAITGTYLPLIQMFEGLISDHVPYRATVSLSAPLLTMLTDDLLKLRYAEHLDKLIELAEKEIDRTKPEPHYNRLAHMYHDRFQSLRHTWRSHEGDLVKAFRMLQYAGRVEVITSTATHAFFPLMDRNWANIRAQVHVAADLYERHFGCRPRGMWLGECGYVPGVDELLREAAIRYFFVDSHGVLFADRRPVYGVYAPLYCPSGVAAFGRDMESSEPVWSAKEGYPGDRHYRDFYRDIGFDLAYEYVRPYLPPTGERVATGLKYHRVTGAGDRKEPYDPALARATAARHAAHYVGFCAGETARLAETFDRPPLLTVPFDAELFGHWWHEGPLWLELLCREIATDARLRLVTPDEYLDAYPTNQVTEPNPGTWGARGHHEVWLTEANDWIYRHLHHAAQRMVVLARRHATAEGAVRRALDQAARELMLAQASDWPFMISRGTTVAYATKRVTDHLARFTRLADDVDRDTIDVAWLDAIAAADALFPTVDYRVFA